MATNPIVPRAPHFAPFTLPLADEPALAREGFPKEIVDAFKRTAVEARSVVLSRTPGAATLGLIDAGYDLKSFFNKMKSCTWGPMAGFVCWEPVFNKKGFAGREDNAGYYHKYVKDFGEQFPIYVKALNDKRKGVNAYKMPDDPLSVSTVPIEISQARLEELQALAGLPVAASNVNECGGIVFGKNLPGQSDKCGVAWDQKCSVFVDFKLKFNYKTGRFAVYVGRVFLRNADSPDSTFELSELNAPGTPETYTFNDQPPLVDAFNTARNSSPAFGTSKALSSYKGASWQPVYGMMNPYPAYDPDSPDNYRNAVTGDFDLFAVWPCLDSSGPLARCDLVRFSDREAAAASSPAEPQAIFERCGDKPFALRSVATPNLVVECVPGFVEIGKGLEDPREGNTSGAVRYVGGTLNAYIFYLYQANKEKPARSQVPVNGVFHSDEGGRPGVKDFDFPIAMFVPNALLDTPGHIDVAEGQAFMIRSNADFVTAMAFFAVPPPRIPACQVAVQFYWLKQVLLDIRLSYQTRALAGTLLAPHADPASVVKAFTDIPSAKGAPTIAPLMQQLLDLTRAALGTAANA